MSLSDAKAVFLSYASQDAEAANRICSALRAAGIEVWLDQNELDGGDAWDRKIRGQITTCALFLPIISASTQARHEGYFRLEWKLAAHRTHMMSGAKAFLLPVVIDATRDVEAHVPEEFRGVQWTRLPGGAATSHFVGRVKTLLAMDVVASLDGARAATTPDGHGRAASRRKRLAKVWAVAIAVVVIGAGSAFIATRKSQSASPNAVAAQALSPSNGARSPAAPSSFPLNPAPAAAPAAASVAVLAFANLSTDKDTEYFSDGVSEEILNTLANHPGLRVAARTSSFSFKGRNVPIAEIGRALNVARVIEGSVRRARDSVRITVKLINVADGYLVWSETLDRPFIEIFSLQSEIASQVVRRLAALAAGSPAAFFAPEAPRNAAAYDLYLRGRAQQLAGNGPRARQLFEEALQLDPGYALAWARISQTHMRVILGGYDRSEATASRARAAVAHALRLDPRLPEALLADATLRIGADYDFDGAEHALREVERLRPNDPDASLLRAMLAQARGLWNNSLVSLTRRAEELDPQNTESLERLGLILQRAGQFSEAERFFARSVALSVNRDAPFRFRAANHAAWTGDIAAALQILESAPETSRSAELYHIMRGTWRAQRGELDAAAADFEKARTGANQNPATGPRIWRARATYRLARLEAQRGRADRARELFAEASSALRKVEESVPDLVRTPYELALIYARQGNRSAALAAVDESTRRAARNGDAYEIATVKIARAEMLAALGEKESSISVLLALHKMGYGFGYTLRTDVEWESLRDHEMFRRLADEAESRAQARPLP
ncbi:TIR domain-containing protein [Horticoccus sp. 23ND18S-11]|uniref:TIR domain-containing protein n=1 Tax=Horticoccus sp. 23ND18S-11 TaxID=3391832 RepID=UPI0039C96904